MLVPRRAQRIDQVRRWLVASAIGLLILASVAPAQAACGVYLAAGSWLSGLGTTVYSNCYQCTDLAERQYDATGWLEGHNFRQVAPTYGAESMIWADGSGWHVRTDVPVATLSAYSGNGSYTPIPGDLVVMGAEWPAGGGAGHVAVVETVSGSTFGVVEQNPGGRATYTKTGSGWVRAGYAAKGFIHSSRNPLGTPPPSGAGTPIQNLKSGRCADVNGASTSPGTPVQLYDCNNSAAQGWRQVGQTLRVYINPDRCLDVTGGNLSRGTPIQIWECSGGNAAQVWSVRADGTIRTANNLCLEARSGETGNGTRLQVWDCNGTPAQHWAGPALDNSGSSVQNLKSGRCIDVAGGSSALGTVVQLFDCNNSAAQRWVRDGQTLRVFGNECLDVKDGLLKSGQPIQVWACSGGNAAQVWSVRADGTIRTANNLCLEARSGETGNGTRLQVWDCNGTPAQGWTGVPVDPGQGPVNPSQPPVNPQPGNAQPPKAAPPAAVSGVRVAFPKRHVAVLGWPAASGATGYRVRVSKLNSMSQWYPWHSLAAPKVTLRKLKKYGTYRLQVASTGPGGISETTTWRFRQKR